MIAQLLAVPFGISPAKVSFNDMMAVKRLLVKELGLRARAMLFDPNCALPASPACLPARTGLMVALEVHGFFRHFWAAQVVLDPRLGVETLSALVAMG